MAIEHKERNTTAWSSSSHSFLIAVLVVTVIIGFGVILEMIAPSGPWRLMIIVAFVFALEGSLTTSWIKRRRNGSEQLRLRAAELIFLILLLRIATWFFTDSFPEIQQLRTFLLEPSHILDFVFIVFLICAIFAWTRANRFSSIFSMLEIRDAEIEYFQHQRQHAKGEDIVYVSQVNRSALVSAFYREWIIGGIILGLTAALTTIRLPEASSFSSEAFNFRNVSRLGMPTEIMLALVIYFIAGLWLGSQARFAAAQGRWLLNGIETENSLFRNWRRVSLITLLLVAALAAFLPIGSTLGISRLLQILLAVGVGIVSIFFLGLIFIVNYVTSLFSGESPNETSELDFDLPDFSNAVTDSGQLSETPELILGIVFWITVLAISAAAVWFFLVNRGFAVRFSRIPGLLIRFWSWVRSFYTPTSEWIQNANSTLVNRLRTIGAVATQSMSAKFFRLNALSYRQQILFFYLSLMKRAERQGVDRGLGHTPLEYTDELKAKWPGTSKELESLTDAFLMARYSKNPINQVDREEAKLNWQKASREIRIKPKDSD